MNGESECPQRYKDATISAFFRRALTHCSTWQETQKEIDRVQQLLVNNGYSNSEVQAKLRRIIDAWYKGPPPPTTHEGTNHKIFYKSHMTSKYKEDERAIKHIIHRNVTPIEADDKLSIVIYYRSKKTSSLLMKNDTTLPLEQ